MDWTLRTWPLIRPRALSLARMRILSLTSILTTKDRVFGFRGVAGAGKTTTLREVTDVLLKHGKAVHCLAPTASAVQVLAKEGFANPATVESFLQFTPNRIRRGKMQGTVVICAEQ